MMKYTATMTRGHGQHGTTTPFLQGYTSESLILSLTGLHIHNATSIPRRAILLLIELKCSHFVALNAITTRACFPSPALVPFSTFFFSSPPYPLVFGTNSHIVPCFRRCSDGSQLSVDGLFRAFSSKQTSFGSFLCLCHANSGRLGQ